MSQIIGGRADKFGNAFERLWIVHLALEVVENQATAIKWEPLGPEGAGIECEVRRDGIREKHQCKIANGTEQRWSVSDLDKVLKAAKSHLQADAATRFVFVSQDPARVLGDLADRARTCDDSARDFLAYCTTTSKEHRLGYQSLCRSWGLNPVDEIDAQTGGVGQVVEKSRASHPAA